MSEEYEIEVIPVVVAEEPIELYKILKIENLVTSGSEAKNYIADGYVYVNGEVETRKRKKIMFGDIIGFNGEAYQVMSAEELAEYDITDEEEFVDPAALESDSVATYITENDVTEDYFTGNNTVEQDVAVEPEFIAPTPVAKPVVDSIPEGIWEQPEKKKKKKSEAKQVKVAEPKPVEKKKKGRAAPFSF
ncbi:MULTISPECIES: RNA-binding S4 domain-containing protein [unclassified Moritella]|uniref:RNA-binding S4 domain-containing protein n=1 Tax=unclassified Moritella TaxID=2637987 RepID=UPI001BAA378A|nr:MULTISPECIES: RNA-binding S4 domain-containing protein [unclassified Moritella]QUM83140.1 RNA-binding S4 domain-containing protein [Moritella sp. 28]QUM87441.1 RNA-binding S4 domain-containing protein [Moritella sp. 36]